MRVLSTRHRIFWTITLMLSLFWNMSCVSTSAETKETLSPEARRVMQMPTDPNIIQVGHYYTFHRHWIWTRDQSRVNGTWISALYLFGNKEKGVFGDGIIRPRLYQHVKNERGGVEFQLIKEWAFDVDEARPFRCVKPSFQGYGYKLPLSWGDLDLSGKEVRMIVTFERRDGRPVESSKKDLIVPGQPR